MNEQRIKNPTIIFFLDDYNKIISVYVEKYEVKDGLVTFKTQSNILSIPTKRIIKIKKKEVENE